MTGHLCLLTGLTYRKNKYSHVFMIGSRFKTQSKEPTKVSLPPTPQKLGGRDVIILDVYISKTWLPSPWERHSWALKLARFTSQRDQRRNLHLQVFRKWSKKGRSGPQVRKKHVQSLVKLRETLVRVAPSRCKVSWGRRSVFGFPGPWDSSEPEWLAEPQLPWELRFFLSPHLSIPRPCPTRGNYRWHHYV